MNARARRRRMAQALLVAAAFAIAVGAASRYPVAEDVGSQRLVRSLADGRDGTIRFVSYTTTRREVLRGDFRNRPVAVTARLDLPRGAAGRVPAVVVVHGSEGPSEQQRRYARFLNERGFATLAIDSFGARGVMSTVGRQEAVTAHSMVVDAYQALGLLADHPRIDPARIGIIGWSKGGVVADWTSREFFRVRLAPGGARFAAHVALYGWCGEQDARVALTGAPLLYLSGGRDDWTGSARCAEYAARARSAGYDVRAVVYPEAAHGFDLPGAFNSFVPEALNWSACAYLARDTGFVVKETGLFSPWTDLDEYFRTCTTRGAHVASHAGARADSGVVLERFLRESL